jgi:DNA-binding MarR family transcriptional regulator
VGRSLNQVIKPSLDSPASRRGSSRLIHLIVQIAMRRERVIQEILRPYGVSYAQWRILVYLGGDRPGVPMTEMAELMVLDRTSLTRAVDKMAAAGFVLRNELPHDRRVIQLSLTDAGVKLRRTLVDLILDHSERLVEGALDDEIRSAGRVLETTLERLVGHRAGARRILDFL